MPALSVVIITYNEERNIARCLESVKDIADDIVVVDSFSNDLTGEICMANGARFFQHEWQGYSGQKNFANTLAKYDWIFSIDADEAISPGLKESILKAKSNPEPVDYRICRMTNYCGKWIHHGGWYPDIKHRFFDRRKTKWEGFIHEKLNVYDENKLPVLQGDCFHYTYYNITQHVAQANHFSTMAAEDLFKRGKRAGLLKLLVSPCLKFIRTYILQLGLLDGFEGWVIARISSHAVFLKYSKLRQFHAEREL